LDFERWTLDVPMQAPLSASRYLTIRPGPEQKGASIS
jgi:hypothetical protein